MKAFSKQLKEVRGALTQKEAAGVIPFLPLATYQAWEQGQRVPPKWVQEIVLSILTFKSRLVFKP